MSSNGASWVKENKPSTLKREAENVLRKAKEQEKLKGKPKRVKVCDVPPTWKLVYGEGGE